MRWTLERVSQPDIEPVTLAEAKRHLRLFDDITTDDDYVSTLITVAREYVEGYTGRALIDQQWRLTLRGEIPASIPLRRSPALAITGFASVDASTGAETEIDVASYEIREAASRWPYLYMLDGTTWLDDTLRVTFRAGFADRVSSPQQDASAVPARIKHAMLLIISNYYELREPVNVGNIVNKLPLGIEWLLAEEMCNTQLA